MLSLMKKARDVRTYIAAAPQELQAKLRQMRATIRKAAPLATEKISYGMPYYGYKGRLAYFAGAKSHIGLYVMPPIIKEHAVALKNYETAKATIRFPLDQKLPLSLIRKLIKASIKRNESKHRFK